MPDIMFMIVCGMVGGNSLSFVLMGFSFGFRYFQLEGERFGLIASHHTMIFRISDFGIMTLMMILYVLLDCTTKLFYVYMVLGKTIWFILQSIN